MPRRSVERVFCLEESVWWPEEGLRGRTSVALTLELLQRLGLIEFIHRHVGVRAEFDAYMLERQRRYRGYGVIYLAFHGEPSGIVVGDTDISLPELQTIVGKAPGAVLHLSSCSVLNANKADIGPFLKATEARILSGFARDVDWVESAAFDQILLSYLAHYSHVGTALGLFMQRHAGLAEHLNWVHYDATKPVMAPGPTTRDR